MADNILRGIIQIEAKGVSQATNQVSTALTKTEAALKRTSTSTNQATFALTNLGRVVQDAPFGFIGIANNINPLLESFQRLKTETGSTGGALKSLGNSLLGAGGIGLAISVLTTGLTFLTSGFGAWTRGIGGASSGVNELDAKMKIFNATIESNKQSIEDITNAYQNFIRVANTNIKFRGFSDIDILKGEAGTFAETVLGPLMDAEAKNFAETNKLIADFGRGIIGSTEEYNKKYEALLTERKDIQRRVGDAELELKFKQAQIRLQQQKADKDAADKALQDQEQYIRGVISRGKELASYFKDVAVVPTFGIFDSIQEQFQKALKLINDIDAGNLKLKLPLQIDTTAPAEQSANSFGDYFTTELGNYFTSRPVTDFSLIDALKPKLKTDAELLGEVFSTSIAQAFVSSFEGIGEGIGNILSGQDFGSGLLDAFSGFLKQIGLALIKYGAIKEGLDKILGPGGIAIPGALAIGLGVAAIAASSLLKNSFGGFRAGGGPVAPGQSYVVGENGRELFVPNVPGTIVPNGRMGQFGGGFMGNVVFRISGNSLVGVLANANSSQFRLG